MRLRNPYGLKDFKSDHAFRAELIIIYISTVKSLLFTPRKIPRKI